MWGFYCMGKQQTIISASIYKSTMSLWIMIPHTTCFRCNSESQRAEITTGHCNQRPHWTSCSNVIWIMNKSQAFTITARSTRAHTRACSPLPGHQSKQTSLDLLDVHQRYLSCPCQHYGISHNSSDLLYLTANGNIFVTSISDESALLPAMIGM